MEDRKETYPKWSIREKKDENAEESVKYLKDTVRTDIQFNIFYRRVEKSVKLTFKGMVVEIVQN